MDTDFWFWGFCTVCKVNFPTMFREPLWDPKLRKIYLTHRAKFPQTKNQYQFHDESLISRSTLDTYYLPMISKFFVLPILPMSVLCCKLISNVCKLGVLLTA